MGITDMIAGFIQEALDDAGGVLEMQRGDLAQRFGCVPSQINYVMSTRFSPEHGYIVESRRGGGGYIKITQVSPKSGNELMHVVNMIGGQLSYTDVRALVQNCYDYDLITQKEAKIMMAALSERSIPVKQPEQDILRAKILKNILVSLV